MARPRQRGQDPSQVDERAFRTEPSLRMGHCPTTVVMIVTALLLFAYHLCTRIGLCILLCISLHFPQKVLHFHFHSWL